jgi:DNA-binding FrmR family transcriptional regulator
MKADGKERRPLRSPIQRKDILQRINRLQGQIKALARTLEEGDDWDKLFTLAATVEGASDQIIADLFQRYLESVTENRTLTDEEKERFRGFRKKLNLVLRRF